MKDVYWADQGRTSVDAVLIALMVGGLFVIGTTPSSSTTPATGRASASP